MSLSESTYHLLGRYENHVLPKLTRRVLLVSPSGDTHLWGLLLPKIILENNGVHVTWMPRCSAQTLRAMTESHHPEFVIITGLLDTVLPDVKDMIQLLSELKTPLILGGVAFSTRWIQRQILTWYQGPLWSARKAGDALDIIKGNVQPMTFGHPDKSLIHTEDTPSLLPTFYSGKANPMSKPQIDTEFDLEEVWSWIPNRTLFTLHLGLRKNADQAILAGDLEAVMMNQKVSQVKSLIIQNRLFSPKVMWQWMKGFVGTDQNAVQIQNENELISVSFPRKNGLCLADYVAQNSIGGIGALVTTAGPCHELVLNWVMQRRYQDAMILNALWVQSAEALAERTHFMMRHQLQETLERPSTQEIQQALYLGKRYSFGYSACPDLSGQQIFGRLFSLSDIGVSLTHTHMLDPESAVTAFVFEHPDAKYF